MLPICSDDPFVSEVGWFSVRAGTLARWIAESIGAEWSVGPLSTPAHRVRDLPEVSALLRAAGKERIFAVLASDASSWCAVVTSGVLGTDLGVLPIHAVDELRCEVIRAVCVPDGSREIYPARLFESWSWRSVHALNHVRAVSVTYDGYKWEFDAAGDVQDFEDAEAYAARRKRDRLTPTMLQYYLRASRVPVDGALDLSTSYLVTGQGWQQALLAHNSSAGF